MEKQENKISRKEAIKKVGITALATSSLILLNTQVKAHASGKVKKNNGWGNGNQDPPGNSGPHNNAENGPNTGKKKQDKKKKRKRKK